MALKKGCLILREWLGVTHEPNPCISMKKKTINIQKTKSDS